MILVDEATYAGRSEAGNFALGSGSDNVSTAVHPKRMPCCRVNCSTEKSPRPHITYSRLVRNPSVNTILNCQGEIVNSLSPALLSFFDNA